MFETKINQILQYIQFRFAQHIRRTLFYKRTRKISYEPENIGKLNRFASMAAILEMDAIDAKSAIRKTLAEWSPLHRVMNRTHVSAISIPCLSI